MADEINNDTNLPVKVPKKKTAPKKAKVKVVPIPQDIDPILIPMKPGTVKIERGKFLVQW
jgi:hypothetical protein